MTGADQLGQPVVRAITDSLQRAITDRGECLVYADGLDRLEMDHLPTAIVTTPPQCSGDAE